MIYCDRTFSQKLESAEARATVDFVETRTRMFPESEAAWIEVAGCYAMFDSPGSPLTQTFGLGLFEPVTDENLDKIEAFFIERGADVFHEVSPMADESALLRLNERGYKPIELTTVMYRDLSELAANDHGSNSAIQTRIITDSESDLWAETAAAGWASEGDEVRDFVADLSKIVGRTKGGNPFIAELNGSPIATGDLRIDGEICLLAGASTIPSARNQGAQNALLNARLKFGAENGCRIAIMGASPGSQSQRNAEKNGFRVAYTRTKWHLAS